MLHLLHIPFTRQAVAPHTHNQVEHRRHDRLHHIILIRQIRLDHRSDHLHLLRHQFLLLRIQTQARILHKRQALIEELAHIHHHSLKEIPGHTDTQIMKVLLLRIHKFIHPDDIARHIKESHSVLDLELRQIHIHLHVSVQTVQKHIEIETARVTEHIIVLPQFHVQNTELITQRNIRRMLKETLELSQRYTEQIYIFHSLIVELVPKYTMISVPLVYFRPFNSTFRQIFPSPGELHYASLPSAYGAISESLKYERRTTTFSCL